MFVLPEIKLIYLGGSGFTPKSIFFFLVVNGTGFEKRMSLRDSSVDIACYLKSILAVALGNG